MSMEPINIFAHRIDPRGVVALLRSLAPGVEVTGPDDVWQEAGLWLTNSSDRQRSRLTFRHKPEYYDGPDWPRQVMGMQSYFSQFPETARKPDILRLIGTFGFALATDWEPDLNSEGDARLEILYAVTRHLDGAIFTPSSLRDAEGRILISADGTADADAVFPRMPPTSSALEQEDELESPSAPEQHEPPTPERVARRALALTAVTARALLEQDDPSEPWVAEFHQDTLAWVNEIGIADELEPDEWKVLQRPPGTLDQRAQIDATWRLEGLAVLAWALHRFELPEYDELVDPRALTRSLGFSDAELARDLLTAPNCRSAAEIETLRKQLLALHWRLRDFRLRPGSMDFRAFSKKCWFGSFDISPFRLMGDDLAIGDYAIVDAPEDLFDAALSAASERHLAINWLTDGGLYSATDTST